MSRQRWAIEQINVPDRKNDSLRGLVAKLLGSTSDVQAIADQRDAIVKQAEENRADMLDGKLGKLVVSEVAGIPPPATLPSPPPNTEMSKTIERANTFDADFSVLNQQPNADLVQFVQLFDSIIASNH